MLRLLLTPLSGLVILLALLVIGGNDPGDLALFVGRFHPALVHLPIGILLLAVLLEALRRSRIDFDDSVVSAVLLLGAWSAILAAIAGLLLSQGGGYDADTLAWHRRLGVAVSLIASAAWFLKERGLHRGRPERGYPAMLGLLVLTVATGGWLGGELTHGPGYQTRYMPDALRNLAGLGPKSESIRLDIDEPEQATVYTTLVRPVFERRCSGCHNPVNRKGGLQLDSPEEILAGGESGRVLVAGQASTSALVRRMWLPLSHPDHMPPEGRPQPTVAEAETIRWWIDQGASFEQRLVEVELAQMARITVEGFGIEEIPTGIFALDVSSAPTAAIEALRALGATVTPLGEQEPFLQVRCTPSDCAGNTLVAALEPLAAQVAWLDLAGSALDDAGLAVLSRLPHLTRLHLQQTRVTDAGLVHLSDLAYLEYLNLYDTRISDAGLVHLQELPRLRSLYLWQTAVTSTGLQALQAARPELEVTLGMSMDEAAAPSTPR